MNCYYKKTGHIIITVPKIVAFSIIRHLYKSFSTSRETRVIIPINYLILDIYNIFKPTMHVLVWGNFEYIIEWLGEKSDIFCMIWDIK